MGARKWMPRGGEGGMYTFVRRTRQASHAFEIAGIEMDVDDGVLGHQRALMSIT